MGSAGSRSIACQLVYTNDDMHLYVEQLIGAHGCLQITSSQRPGPHEVGRVALKWRSPRLSGAGLQRINKTTGLLPAPLVHLATNSSHTPVEACVDIGTPYIAKISLRGWHRKSWRLSFSFPYSHVHEVGAIALGHSPRMIIYSLVFFIWMGIIVFVLRNISEC